jgi:hypothetical protein
MSLPGVVALSTATAAYSTVLVTDEIDGSYVRGMP